MKANDKKYTILYGRLSQEDDRDGESNSIGNQRLMLEKYAEEKGFENCKFLFDDGYSGTNFNRPSWNEIMSMIESGQVETLIVKDMSRLGRDYLQTGYLLEHTFPNYKVRFIAINDAVDTLYGDNDFTPFRNLFNDFYAKDCSKKIRAVKKAQAERGERLGKPPYGYMKDENDPKQIIPNPETASIVQYIFNLCLEGRGPNQIARQLSEEEILNPSNYNYQKTGAKTNQLDTTRPYRWRGNSIVNILDDETYIGNTVSMQHTTASYKNKKQIIRPENEWLRFENTHQAIIKKEVWDIAQQLRQSKKRSVKEMDTPNPYSGLIFCADCGKMLNLHRAHTMAESKNNFMCSTYKRYGKEECSSHYLRQTILDKIILDDIKRVTHFARQDEALFTKHINEKNTVETRATINKLQKELDIMTKRDIELTVLFKRLYEDNVLGRIPDEHYRTLSEEYTAEQKSLRINIPKAKEDIEKQKNSLTNVDRFIEKAKKYTDLTELTPEILHLFVEKIVVGEKAEKYSRTAPQDIWIYYRDIGMLSDVKKEFDIEPIEEFCKIDTDEIIEQHDMLLAM
ncbi:recombinase family protein [Chakrabartyella piscis]|uniref:recombinase family protein n=1 Tax=Chakrabartyella piscis TaxID=2918914 RepID=UPI0029583D8A|nr:recombinase family protein [Chakrabartyella piscis]